MNILAIIVMLLIIPSAWATPAKDLQVTYDAAGEMLTVAANHPSRNLNKHFIRKIEVRVNSNEPKQFLYNYQVMASGVLEHIPYTLVPGDVVSVIVNCAKGGEAAATLIIP